MIVEFHDPQGRILSLYDREAELRTNMIVPELRRHIRYRYMSMAHNGIVHLTSDQWTALFEANNPNFGEE